jgi:lipopolysaccharide transport system permease protein
MRYRRSVLGPFWMTLSMAVFVVTLGVIYSTIFHTEIRNYLPYIAVGFISWGFISTATMESCGAFLESEALIKQLQIPFSIFVMRVVWRNFLVLLHTIILIVPIWIIFSVEPKLSMLLALPGLALVFINQVWLGLVIAILSTRFRDVPQIVQTALQVAVFATPIMWPVSTLGSRIVIADVNPAYHLIELVRAPLTGGVPALLSWAVAIGMAVIGLLLAAALLRRASRRIVYWL